MDIGASNWTEDDNSNTTAAPDGAPEGMAPSGVNNVLRAHQGAIKRWYNWMAPKLTAGSGSAYTLSYSVAPSALVDGMTHLVEFDQANGAAPTLNINGLGAIPIHYYSVGAWRIIPPGLLGANEICRVAYHISSGTYRILGRPDTTGDYVPTSRSTARSGTVLAYGQAVSRTQYAGLFAACGTTYGAGDGSTTFNLPDLRGRVVAGKDDMGGSAAGRLSVPISGSVLGATGGAQVEQAGVVVSGILGGSTSGSLGLNVGASSGDNQLASAGASSATLSGAGHLHPGGNTTGSLSVAVSGSMSGITDLVQNVPPTIIGNYAICL